MVTIFVPAGAKTHEVVLAPRSRMSFNVGDVFGLSGDQSFGLEVLCAVCAASLVMWDAEYTTPAVSAPVIGCR